MYYTYSRHQTYDAAFWALDDYFANGELFDSDDPQIVRHGQYWAVQILDALYCY